MPELPEVETVRKIIEPLIKGKTIDKVDIFFDRLVLSDLKEFKKKLINKKINKIERYGKYLFFILSDDLVIINHLRMEGKWRFINKDSQIRNKFTTALFHFSDGTKLAFDDTRKFGIMQLSTISEYKNLEMISKLGIEPTNITKKNFQTIREKFNSNKCLKDLLLDQTIFCGIGNIYADEIAYDVKLSPFIKGKEIENKKIEDVCLSAKKILERAIECGGSTIHSFHPAEGIDGRMQGHLKCYGKVGEECPNCGTKFHKTFIGGRGTTYCPNCQLDESMQKAIAITGPIGSGKSTVLNYFKKNGYKTLSCDEIIHELYRNETNRLKVSRILGIDFNIDNDDLKNEARKILIKDKTKKIKIENYIYPILENELIKYIKKYDKIIIEVPLLFKAHFEYMFKKIILIKVTKEKQILNLKSRGSNVDDSLNINNDFYYNKSNKNVVILNNNGSLKDLENNLKKLI